MRLSSESRQCKGVSIACCLSCNKKESHKQIHMDLLCFFSNKNKTIQAHKNKLELLKRLTNQQGVYGKKRKGINGYGLRRDMEKITLLKICFVGV